jgi:hypothetical protein
MKKQVQILGLVAAMIFLLGSAFKVNHYPGASILLTLGAAAGVIYLILYFLMGINSLSHGLEKTSGIVGAAVLAIVLISFLFKTNHWPGGSFLVMVSQAGLFITGFLMLMDAYKETDLNKQSLKALSSFMVFILMVILFYITFLLNKPTT